MNNTPWKASDSTQDTGELSHCDPIIEFNAKGEWQNFTLVPLPDRILFGGVCNVGFIESGYIEREDGETLDETLQELLADLQTYYEDGPAYVSRIVCNERM